MAAMKLRRAPYKDFLQPALQRRFATIALVLLALSFGEALVFSSWTSLFWTIFPFSFTGVRASFIFACGLAIIVLRISQYHVGHRTSQSGIATARKNALTVHTLEAALSYTLSAWLLSQIFLWSRSNESGLQWIRTLNGDRKRVNEQPIFFTCHALVFGLALGLWHTIKDNDRLLLGSVTIGKKKDGQKEAVPLMAQVAGQLPGLVANAGVWSAGVLLMDTILYPMFFRRAAWRMALMAFRPFYELPKTNMLPAHLPYSINVLWPCFYTSFMLLILWTAGNRLFSRLLVRAPLKNGQPLTSESKDPNGSLLNGMKSKKLPVKCFAFWELALIAESYEPRRKAIYQDINRKDGPMFSQVYALCIDIIKSIDARVDAWGKIETAAAQPAPAPPRYEASGVVQKTRTDPIVLNTPPRKSIARDAGRAIDHLATVGDRAPRLSPMAKKAMSDAKTVMAGLEKKVLGAGDQPVHEYVQRFLQSPFGAPFRHDYSRRLTMAVLGEPYAEPSMYLNAIAALTELVAKSITEDTYGNVQRDVASVIRTFTLVALKIEGFKSKFPTHWTDVDGTKECEPVDAVLAQLREGLKELLAVFGSYARDLRLSYLDLRMAKEAAGIEKEKDNEIARTGPEMRELRR